MALIWLLLAWPVAGRAEDRALRIIGAPGSGCIAGAVALQAESTGLQAIRFSRSVFWGAPVMIATLQALGRAVSAAGLPDLYMGDIAGPRGGPIPGGHVGHQIGLEADVYLDLTPKPALSLAQRDALEPASLVRPDGRGVDPARWTQDHVTLLRLAAGLPGIDRILVNPAIKRQLCLDVTGDRAWLRLIRPWWGHASHMHIRLRCPEDQPECVQGPPPPPGDGCDATLQWWFDQLDAPPRPPAPASRPAPPPPACRAILAGAP